VSQFPVPVLRPGDIVVLDDRAATLRSSAVSRRSIGTALISATGNPIAPAYYVIFGGVLGLIAVYFVREGARRPLLSDVDAWLKFRLPLTPAVPSALPPASTAD
jgi:hypothetical protein